MPIGPRYGRPWKRAMARTSGTAAPWAGTCSTWPGPLPGRRECRPGWCGWLCLFPPCATSLAGCARCCCRFWRWFSLPEAWSPTVWPGACPSRYGKFPGLWRPSARAISTDASISCRPGISRPWPRPSTSWPNGWGSHVREIEERRRRQEAILDGMAEGVAILDARGRMVAVNRAFEAMFPQCRDPVGKTPIEAGLSLAIERCLTGEIPGPGGPGCAGRIELPGNRVAEVSVVPVAGIDEAGATRVATFHDVTEAAAMDAIFRDFVIDASHRLRTPLTKVQAMPKRPRIWLPRIRPGRWRRFRLSSGARVRCGASSTICWPRPGNGFRRRWPPPRPRTSWRRCARPWLRRSPAAGERCHGQLVTSPDGPIRCGSAMKCWPEYSRPCCPRRRIMPPWPCRSRWTRPRWKFVSMDRPRWQWRLPKGNWRPLAVRLVKDGAGRMVRVPRAFGAT